MNFATTLAMSNLTMTRTQITIATIGLSLFAVCSAMFGQRTNSAPARKDVYAPLTRAPRKAVARRNPLEQDPEAVLAGGKLYELHCMECHGDMADGGKKAPSLRAPEVQQATPGTLFWILTNGVVRRGMPVWSKLPEPQRWQLVSYIKSLTPPVAQPAPETEKEPQKDSASARPSQPRKP
jgi:mono/diheme cytochrome c family protein